MKSKPSDCHNTPISQRLDTWLWASRFFKTRKLSAEAVKAGHVSVNGLKGKPARMIKLDDEIKFKRFLEVYVVIVTGLSDKRLGAALAANLYAETEQSIVEREEKRELLKNQRAGIQYDRGRPGKRDRQRMTEFKERLTGRQGG